jgi:hypothetical protein
VGETRQWAKLGRYVVTELGCFRGCTRVLVTHQTQWLHACDRVYVLRRGAVIGEGPWKDLHQRADLPELKHVATEVSLDADVDLEISGSGSDSSRAGTPIKSETLDAGTLRGGSCLASKGAGGAEIGNGGEQNGAGIEQRECRRDSTVRDAGDGGERGSMDGRGKRGASRDSQNGGSILSKVRKATGKGAQDGSTTTCVRSHPWPGNTERLS